MFIEVRASKRSLALRRKVYGVGINDAPYMIEFKDHKGRRFPCPFYKKWSAMLERCYSVNGLKKNPAYAGCSVCPEWLTFTNFKHWMTEQDWEGNELDKDILQPGNRTYSPSVCAFVPSRVNSLLTSCASSRGKWPQGVHFNEKDKRFIAQININGKHRQIGVFSSSKLAQAAYVTAKALEIYKIAEDYPHIREGLCQHAALLIKEYYEGN